MVTIGEYDTIIGVGLIIVGLIFNLIHTIINNKNINLKKEKSIRIASFAKLCQEIYPFIKDNEYIFNRVGPNSNITDKGILRTDFTMWEECKKGPISNNNKKIKDLIEDNKGIIPDKHWELFNDMIIHIDSFKKHISEKDFDYSNNQFPKRLPDIIKEESFEEALKNKKLKKKIAWITKKIRALNISNGIIFGSSLLLPQKARDFDIAILIEESEHLKTQENINKIKAEFKNKFRTPLHITFFYSKEEPDFSEFCDKNKQKIYL